MEDRVENDQTEEELQKESQAGAEPLDEDTKAKLDITENPTKVASQFEENKTLSDVKTDKMDVVESSDTKENESQFYINQPEGENEANLNIIKDQLDQTSQCEERKSSQEIYKIDIEERVANSQTVEIQVDEETKAKLNISENL